MAQAATNPESLIEEEGKSIAHKWKAIIAAIVLIGALGYLGFMAFQSATVYAYSVGEVLEMGPAAEGKTVRVNGKLVPASFARESDSTLAFFSLTDGSDTMLASHNGVLPDLFFNEHSEIILEGYYRPDGVFESHNVLVKCPSKYIAEGDAPPATYGG